MTLEEELSKAEKLMFEGLGFSQLFLTDINPMALYRMAVEKAFLENKNDGYTKALRAAFKRLTKSEFRRNSQHDDVILKEIHVKDLLNYEIRTNGLQEANTDKAIQAFRKLKEIKNVNE